MTKTKQVSPSSVIQDDAALLTLLQNSANTYLRAGKHGDAGKRRAENLNRLAGGLAKSNTELDNQSAPMLLFAVLATSSKRLSNAIAAEVLTGTYKSVHCRGAHPTVNSDLKSAVLTSEGVASCGKYASISGSPALTISSIGPKNKAGVLKKVLEPELKKGFQGRLFQQALKAQHAALNRTLDKAESIEMMMRSTQ